MPALTKSEAVSRLSVAFDRCRGDSIPLSAETSQALGLKSGTKSISKADARKLIDADEGSHEPEVDDPPKPAKPRKGKKSDESPVDTTPDTPPGEDPLS